MAADDVKIARQDGYAEIRRALRGVPKIEFFARRRIVSEGFFGLAFDDGPGAILAASFDRSFRELLIHGFRPPCIHLPKLRFDYGEIETPSGLSLHVVSCERLAPIEPLSGLWQVERDLSQAYAASASPSPPASQAQQDLAIAAQVHALSAMASSYSLKECVQGLGHFAVARGLAFNPYFGRGQENIMARGEDIVFVNPLYDPAITGFPSWIFAGLGASNSSFSSEDEDLAL